MRRRQTRRHTVSTPPRAICRCDGNTSRLSRRASSSFPSRSPSSWCLPRRRARPARARAGRGGRDGATTAAAPAVDPLGRSTPRGTVWGFLHAARKGELDLARQYLDTQLGQQAAEELAQQLFVVLDARLPARLTQISDVPEGSRTNPLQPDQDLVGTVSGAAGSVDILLDRVRPANEEPIWLISNTTLDAIPGLYKEVSSTTERRPPAVIAQQRPPARRPNRRMAGRPAGDSDRILRDRSAQPAARYPLARPIWRRMVGDAGPPVRSVLPVPARLLLLCVLGNWLLSFLSLSLLVRQFWSSVARTMAIVAGRLAAAGDRRRGRASRSTPCAAGQRGRGVVAAAPARAAPSSY